MKEERLMILSMLEEGKITSEEAIKLLEAIEESQAIGEEEENSNRIVDVEKTKEKMKDFGNVLKEQGKKVEEFSVDLGNKVSGFFRDMKDIERPKVFSGKYDVIETSLEKNISHIENPIIDIKSINGNISVKPWEKDHMSMDINCRYKNGLFHEGDEFYDFSEEDNRLVFLPKVSNNIELNLNIYLPDKIYGGIQLNTSNGGIQIKSFNTNKLQCIATNGTIAIKDMISQETLLKTKNGRIDLDSINSNNLVLLNSNGRITLNHIVGGDISATTSNGIIDGEDIDGENIMFNTSNGKIIIKDIMPDRIKSIKLYTSNAPIDAKIASIKKDCYFDLQTSMGNISLEIPNLVYKVNEQGNLGTGKIVAHSSGFNRDKEHFELIASTSRGSIKLW